MAYDIIIGRDASDKKAFGNRGLINIGKGYVKMGQYTSLSNRILMDVARSHVVLVAGKRGSGKSHTMGVIAEELTDLPQEASQNIASLMFDTMGIYWTMKYKNEKDKNLLEEWDLKPKNLPVKIFVPFGHYETYLQNGIPIDDSFALDPMELGTEDWILTFGLDITNPISILIQRVLTDLKNSEEIFDLDIIITNLEHDHKSTEEIRNAAIGLFEAAKSWGIFSDVKTESTQVKDLVAGGRTTVLDLSVYNSVGAFNIRALVISIISRKIFKQRMEYRKKEEVKSVSQGISLVSADEKKEYPLVWIFIDECLTGNTEIITDKSHTPLQEVINKFQKGEKINVLGYNLEDSKFAHYPVKEVFKKGKRKTIEITTETGRKIICTPEHRILTREGFASALSVNEVATPLIQHYSEDTCCVKARLVGHLFGDGWASEKQQSLGFSGKRDPNDLNKIKRDLSLLNLKSSNIFSRNTHSTITDISGKKIMVNGKSHSLSSSKKSYRYFEPLGIIKGDKITQISKVPTWIKNSSEKVKAEFLAALMGSDGQRITKAKNAKGDFNAIRLSFNKLESLEKEAITYSHELKDLFESLNVKVGNISKQLGNIRKNGEKTIKIVITLEKNLPNTIVFLEKIGYRYCSEKEIEGLKWLAYLKTRLFLKSEREKIYYKIHKLHKDGLGKRKISKILNFPEPQVRDWLYLGNKPGLPKTFPDINEWLSKRVKQNVLYEWVFRMEESSEQEVYDISVEKVHNFVSNRIIAHNCHEFLPLNGKTAATDALIQLLREGRQPGISVVLATQQPGQIHYDVMTQSDIVIAHRVTSKQDLEALNYIMQSYVLESVKKQMDDLPSLKGSAIVLDDNSERIYPVRIRPRFTWHGGEAPVAIRAEKQL